VHVQPRSAGVCVGGSATLTCTIILIDDLVEVTDAGWQILNMNNNFVPVINRHRHSITRTTSSNETILIEILTINNVILADNGTTYRCKPIPKQLSNNTVSLIVAGKIVYNVCTPTVGYCM